MPFFDSAWSLKRFFTPKRGRNPKPTRAAALWLERLEERCTPAVHNLTHNIGTNYVTIQAAIDAATPNDVILADAGTYTENLTITKAITLEGAKFGQDAGARFTSFVGGKANPAVESVLTTPTNNPTGGNPGANDLIRVLANNVVIDGLVIDGNNPSLHPPPSAVMGNGVAIDARRGITNIDATDAPVAVSHLLVENDIIQNVAQRGVSLDNNGTVGTNNLITGNVIHNFGSDPTNGGFGVLLLDNAYADVTNNTILDDYFTGIPQIAGQAIGLQQQRFTADGAMTWSGNHVTVGQDDTGVSANVFTAPNGVLNILSNTVNAATGVTGADDQTWGVYVLSIQGGSTVNLTGNTVGSGGGQFARGLNFWNLTTTRIVTVSGGTVANSVVGVDLESVDPLFGTGNPHTAGTWTINLNNVAVTGGTTGVRIRAATVNQFNPPPTSVDPLDSVAANLTGVTVSGATTGVLVQGFSPTITAAATLFRDTITGATTGVQVNANGILGSPAQQTIQNVITGNTTGIAIAAGAGTVQPIIDNDLSGNSGLAYSNGSGTLVDASLNWWGLNTASAVAAKAGANVDYTPFFDSGLNTQPAGTPGFQGDFSVLDVAAASPQAGAVGRIQEGVNDVLAGGTVNVAAGTYAENVTIGKNLTLTGVPGSPAAAIVQAASGDGIVINGPATAVTVKNLEVTGAAIGVNASGVGTVTLQNLKLDGDGTGFTASNLTTLNLSNLTLPATPAAGGTISNVSTVNFDASGQYIGAVPGFLTSILDATAIGYSGVTTLNLDSASAVNAIAGPDTADRATAFAGLNPDERFVQALYLADLGRAGAKAELDGWVTLFGAPGRSQLQAQIVIATGIEHSQEAEDHLVRTWYATYLGRQAGGGEEQGWVNELLAGQTEESVLSGIVSSPEFYARAQTLTSSGSADQRYVQALYLLLLNRTGEAAGVAAWIGALPSLGRQGVALDFLTGQEFRTDQFEGYYNALLHRPDDQPSLNNWVMLNLDVAAVRIYFEASPEFFLDG